MGVSYRPMVKRLKAWWEGRYIPPDNPPGSDLVMLLGRYQRHWTSRFAHVLVAFYLREWKWIWGFLAALVAAGAAVLRLTG